MRLWRHVIYELYDNREHPMQKIIRNIQIIGNIQMSIQDYAISFDFLSIFKLKGLIYGFKGFDFCFFRVRFKGFDLPFFIILLDNLQCFLSMISLKLNCVLQELDSSFGSGGWSWAKGRCGGWLWVGVAMVDWLSQRWQCWNFLLFFISLIGGVGWVAVWWWRDKRLVMVLIVTCFCLFCVSSFQFW